MAELNAISIAASAKPEKQATVERIPDLGFPKILSEAQIPPSGTTEPETPEEQIENAIGYEVVEARPDDAFDPDISKIAFLHPYYAYTKKYDEVIEAAELADRAELMKLHKYLSSFVRAMKKLHDVGVAQILSGLRLKGDQRLAVSILIDNSGSMRGRPITITAAWSLLIGEWLDRIGVANEFLGFTTRAWKGGQSRELWLADGKPAGPGRLNDLRHLVFKSFAADVSASAPNFAVMMREGLLKENIDGEAVLWAAARLRNHPADKKILFVFSDGAPVDDSTLSVNPGNFLEKHLRDVISMVSAELTLYAVGIGHNMSRYYPMSVTANDSNDVGFRFFETLIKDPAFLHCYARRENQRESKRSRTE
jgi:cobaltochelatase CobT